MACGADLIVLPICRGEGLAQKLIQALTEHYGLYIGIYMAAAARRIYHRLGYSELEPMTTYRRFVKLNRAIVCAYLMQKTTKYPSLNRIISIFCRFGFDKMVALTGNILIMSRNFLLTGAKKGHQTELIEIMSFGDDIDQLWNITNSKFNVIVKRDQQYLNWRFSKNTNLDYRCFIGKRDGVTKGYIVLRNPAIIELNIGIIMDIYAAPDDHETIEDLIRHAINFFGESVTFIECPTTQQEHQRALLKLGFLAMEKIVPVLFCKDAELKKELEGLNNGWFLTKSDHDSDQLRPI
jgi:ribosomal protein S18 acetylase RimI-like enzyme